MRSGIAAALSFLVAVCGRRRPRSPGLVARGDPAETRRSGGGGGVLLPAVRSYSTERSAGKMGKKTALPDRWRDYKAIGSRIPGTRFISFKVPLKKAFESKLDPAQYFSPFDLIQRVHEQKEDLGLIIDLTFTTRYYGPQEIPKDVEYLKIFTVGHEVPNNQTILKFKRVVRRFLKENADNDKLVGVHCTHGLNRTGYLICRYLIDVDGMEPRAAIRLFNQARGHAIERQNYIDDLLNGKSRSNKDIDMPDLKPVRGWAGAAQDEGFQDPQHLAPRFPLYSPLEPFRPSPPWQHNGQCSSPYYSEDYNAGPNRYRSSPAYSFNPYAQPPRSKTNWGGGYQMQRPLNTHIRFSDYDYEEVYATFNGQSHLRHGSHPVASHGNFSCGNYRKPGRGSYGNRGGWK
ncbi:RNA/RNP complex-1-interacting phosphatase-like [Latimeria chalumnae]|uniref:RNA/RNP complex-1-interacting phosphatase-like n=1 Tax=Latimeria chalumnae TaxID=7897 RepID=UPI00313D212A